MSGKSSGSDSIQFLASLRELGVQIRAEQGNLVCDAPKGTLSPELRRQLSLRKSAILELLEPSSYSAIAVQRLGSRAPLFGIHSTRYRTLSTFLGTEQPLYALRYGLARTSVPPPLPRRLDELVEHYVEEMREIQPEGPYHLMGLCIGGLIAFEMALLLVERGKAVGLLALFDSVAPGGRVPLPLHRSVRNLLRARDREFFRRARGRLRTRVRRIQHEDRGDIAQGVYRDHVPSRVYQGDVELFRPADRVSLTHRFANDLGWSALVRGRLEVHEVPGEDHTAMFEEPQVRTVAEWLTACLNRAHVVPAAREPGLSQACEGPGALLS